MQPGMDNPVKHNGDWWRKGDWEKEYLWATDGDRNYCWTLKRLFVSGNVPGTSIEKGWEGSYATFDLDPDLTIVDNF